MSANPLRRGIVRQLHGGRMEQPIAASLSAVRQRMRAAYDQTPADVRWPQPPRLVAVSKTQSAHSVRLAYEAGQTVFGENYPQELIEKAADPLLSEQSCPGLRWRFIGTLQSNKVPKLIGSVPNLEAVESVASVKLANLLQAACERRGEHRTAPLDVLIQVNTSGEGGKSGAAAGDAEHIDALAGHIMQRCPRLRLAGFMTIGALARSQAAHSTGGNEDFDALTSVRRHFLASAAAGDIEPGRIELSMGMSADFEPAIGCGASSVRVGSAIFGARS